MANSSRQYQNEFFVCEIFQSFPGEFLTQAFVNSINHIASPEGAQYQGICAHFVFGPLSSKRKDLNVFSASLQLSCSADRLSRMG